MNLQIKALQSPREDTSLLGRLRSKWWTLRWWWTDRVWLPYAPRWLSHLWFQLKDLHYRQISCRIWPRQAWLTKAAGRTWRDKPELLADILFAAIIHFVEEEDCFNVNLLDDPFASELRDCYDWAKTGRAAAYKAMEDSWHPGPVSFEGGFHMGEGTGSMEDYMRLETAAQERDTRYLRWIIDQRAMLWT